MNKNPEEEKKKAGEKAYIIERGRDEKTGIVYERAIREVEQPPEDNITPFKEALRKLSEETKKVSEFIQEPVKELSEQATGISAALEEIQKTLPAAMAQITAITSEITASEEFKKAKEIAELEISFRKKQLKGKFYKDYIFERYKMQHREEMKEATPEEIDALKKQYYRAPSWEEILEEHREAIQNASEAEIALSTRENGSIVIPGTMYEHYKNAWREHLEAYEAAKRNIITSAMRLENKPIFHKSPAMNNLFPLKPTEGEDIVSFEFNSASQEDRENNIDVVTYIDVDFSEIPIEFTKELTSFDGEVFCACFSLCREAARKAGGGDRDLFPCITTPREIYRAMGYDKALGGNQKEDILQALEKMDITRIKVDNSQEILNNYKTSLTIRKKGWGSLFRASYLSTTIEDQKGIKETQTVKLLPSDFMDYIANRGQYTAINREFFSLVAASGLYMNDRALTVRNYIIKAILTQDRRNGDITILFETLCKKCNISRNPKDNQEKRTTKKIIEPILEAYKGGHLIKGYKIIEKDKIIIHVEDPAPKLEAGKNNKKGKK